MPAARIVSVNRSSRHRFSKAPAGSINLIAGLGVEGDAHAGVTVQHLSRLRTGASLPNLRQVHLIPTELLEEIGADGTALDPGDLGENVATAGLDILALPRGTILRLGETALIEVTGLRNPCAQIEAFRPGLLARVVHKDADGTLVRRAGIMAVVRSGGVVYPGDRIEVRLPDEPHARLEPV